ncbi:Apolipoprotein C-II [Merluccius polli]|uniref:Apolipoprotein C-II n=1 Tax=Merluccius polli TaxID=89951 RepID=A0AA47N336_MERPO|nr:Apolipoprotein C-II [Merluccius polli]
MNKLLIIAVMVTLLALSAESSRMPRQAVEEERGTMTKITDSIRSYYDDSITTANGYIESIKGMKMEEKAMNMFEETSKAVSTYATILQDQLYHYFVNREQ